jgi:hypothetical protein
MDLPFEVVNLIWSFIPFFELARSRMTSKKWKDQIDGYFSHLPLRNNFQVHQQVRIYWEKREKEEVKVHWDDPEPCPTFTLVRVLVNGLTYKFVPVNQDSMVPFSVPLSWRFKLIRRNECGITLERTNVHGDKTFFWFSSDLRIEKIIVHHSLSCEIEIQPESIQSLTWKKRQKISVHFLYLFGSFSCFINGKKVKSATSHFRRWLENKKELLTFFSFNWETKVFSLNNDLINEMRQVIRS